MQGILRRSTLALGLVGSLWLTTAPAPAFAQSETAAQVWIQIEAQPSLVEAEERVRDYSADLPGVHGFVLGGGWYAIALGPFDEATAAQQLQDLRRAGRVPRDSYLAQGDTYARQFWPLAGATSPPAAEAEVVQAQANPTPLPSLILDAEPDETPAQARRSEAQLTRSEREDLQVALQWAGYYSAAIDGAFGRGTRSAMAAWQVDNDLEPTGVLTTRQRAQLLGQYNAVLEGVGLERVADPTTGIEMLIPQGMVAFEAYEAPFARYAARDGSGVQLIQISRPGDQTNLFGLYDILQTLEIVPREGDRTRRANGFSITGQNDRIISQTEVTLQDGAIKGYILVWPSPQAGGDEAQRSRVLSEIAASYRPIEGVMPLSQGITDTQSYDLLSGLKVRQPLRGRSGVFVDTQGAVLTAAEAVAGCGGLTIDDLYAAQVTAIDETLGVALLQPETPLAPQSIAALTASNAVLQAEVAVSGYSYEGALGAPTLTFGTLAATTGLQGEPDLDRLALAALPGDVGGPVFDMTGAMIGVLQPREIAGKQLPDDVAFATDALALADWLGQAGVTPVAARGSESLSPAALTRAALPMTVLVTCWE